MKLDAVKVYAVVLDVHYSCGEAIGVAKSLDGAKTVAQEHWDAKSAACFTERPPLVWEAHPATLGWRFPRWCSSSASYDYGESYTITEHEQVS